ncbi:ABC transporter, transmembrane region:ABC transporter:Peptidase C39, bacteriocin processing [Thioalkalivibrio nitratireducens DSM 14787]|uniref:ABC transporter, transmembrane region:ABC transporter:Peptidase C39, bacteriocin processing n=1 Tax=Thioalkalivibrio nitratireducens (strain DSM 14787 / UNIQEM 213 / ALEN2) TaxID=1255043 RepID=L0DS38_THIND|nr:type I secretion system permease/ATPase [Thioalkalivibrio nitratireducens]AGA31823.1 ABC transporter, transmembrane region:ABC transporter:Peptidase C39, bacteriocin processing [Thioalkalivibrio nitratireducens DSM 14787]
MNDAIARGSGDSRAQDSLLGSLVLIAKTHGVQLTREAAMAGLPAPEGRLTPSLFERAARRAGLSSRIVQRDPRQLRDELLPAVLLLEGDEACVLVAWNDDRSVATVVYPDLSDARVDLPWSQLKAAYTGWAIYARPTFRVDARSPEVSKESRGHWFWGVVRENKGLYRDVLVAAFMVNLFALAMPLFVLNVYDRVVPNHAVETLFMFAAGVVIVLIAELLLRTMRAYFVDKAAARADVKLSAMIMERVLGMRMENYPASVGAFASRLNSFEAVRSFISSATVLAFVDLPFVLLFIAVIALIAWPLAVPVVIGAVVLLVWVLFVHRKLRGLAESIYRARAQRNSTLVESLNAAETIKTLGAEGRVQALWEKASAHIAEQNTRNRLLSTSVSNGSSWIQRLVGVTIVIAGVFLIINGALSLGGLIASYLISNRAMSPIGRTAGLMVHYHQASTALRSLNRMMELEVERPPGSSFLSRPRIQGDIEFRDVSFVYPNQTTPALDEVSFRIAAGERVAVLGRVGSGKTTIAKLILDLYQPSDGAILIDGVDIRQLDPAELRRAMGHVSQDVTLFYGSLRDNIVLGSPLAEDDAILKAIRISGMEDLINRHPQGVDMEVGERGSRLSGGQKQSVGIARAVIHEPSILLLDEPTSAMDHSTERAIKAQLREFLKGRTALVITHRTSLLELVDRIIVMDHGQIVADGPKEQVMEALRQGRIKKART